ncbi:MAG: carboxymuconolactone decarboxylase family protein, partial [Parascardovia denticolens]
MAKIVQTADRDGLGDFAPQFAHFNDDVLFGEEWNNEDISLKARSIITISVFIGRGLADSSLLAHLKAGKANGISKTEIAAIITHAAFYAGWPVAWAAFNLAKQISPIMSPAWVPTMLPPIIRP